MTVDRMLLSASVDGYRVSARLHSEKGSGPVVVLVHGMMESGEIWHELIRRLKPAYCCIELNLPWDGYQGGRWGIVRTPEAWLGVVWQRLGLNPDAVIAHSFGASALVGLLTDRDRPACTCPLILLSPFYKGDMEQCDWPLLRRYVRDFPRFVEESIRSRTREKQLDEDIMTRMVETGVDAFGTYAWIQFWTLFVRMPFMDLSRLKGAVQIITGEIDTSTTVGDLQMMSSRLVDSSLFVLRDCGHFLTRVRPEETFELIEKFLQDNVAT